MKLIKTTIFFSIIIIELAAAQIITGVAPLKPGNKWVYQSYIAGDYSNPETDQYLITDSIKVINGIPFYAVLGGIKLDYTMYYGLTPDQYFARYVEFMTDSLFKYFKANIKFGDAWEQQWEGGITLYSTIIDTFTAKVFNKNTLIYTMDRRDSSLIHGSREYWTKEYGMLNGIYEQAEDILVGCVIDGVLYGDTTITGIDEAKELPDKFVLYQNYPNPFNPNTVISWQLVTGSKVRLEIYNILGEKIKTLIDEYYSPGKYNISFNAEELPSGIYFYRLITEDFIQTKKMMLVR
jgi:hypothetical protein